MVTSYRKQALPFMREQLIYVVDVILCGCVDRIESGLPTCIEWKDRLALANKVDTDPLQLVSYDRGALEGAGMALAVLYANLTDDGLGIYDALHAADQFHKKCEQMVCVSWEDEGVSVASKMKAGVCINDIVPCYPNTTVCATVFVDSLFDFNEDDELITDSKPTYEVPLRKSYQHRLHNGIVVVNGKMKVEAKDRKAAREKVNTLFDADDKLQTVDQRIEWDYQEAQEKGLRWDYKHDCAADSYWEYQDFSFVVAD